MLNVKIRYNDENEELFCCFDKQRIQLGEKFATVIIQMYDGSVEELVYRLENLPCEDEYEDYDQPFISPT
jgi:hypothetical protein